MDSSTASRLAAQLSAQQRQLCQHVSSRLLSAFPEISRSLRLEENYNATDRLSQVAVERLNELVRSVLLFELPALADHELRWAHGVLPPRGVTYQQQSAMVRWFFEEVRRLPLTLPELELTREIEQHFVNLVNEVYQHN
jgi:hypothetical protein